MQKVAMATASRTRKAKEEEEMRVLEEKDLIGSPRVCGIKCTQCVKPQHVIQCSARSAQNGFKRPCRK